MVVVVIRHGKVRYIWSRRASSEQFDAECAAYDRAPLVPGPLKAPVPVMSRIYVSTLSRTEETAVRMFGDAAPEVSDLLHEVPLSASFHTTALLPLWFWKVSGRLQWLFDLPGQKEGRTQTRQRARRLVQALIEKNEDCILVTHGFFMHTLLGEMKKAGFRIRPERLHYRNAEAVFAETRRR